MLVKPELRILGIDDSPFSRGDRQVLVVGAVFRGGEYLDGLLSTSIAIDGTDSTDKLIQLINKSRNVGQLRLIMLDGITLGGFNIIDIQKLNKETKLPVCVIIRDLPDFLAIDKALNHFKDKEERTNLIKKAGDVYEYKVKNKTLDSEKKIFYQIAGITRQDAEKILKLTIRRGIIPEPIRVAHLIGQGIRFGESKGRA